MGTLVIFLLVLWTSGSGKEICVELYFEEVQKGFYLPAASPAAKKRTSSLVKKWTEPGHSQISVLSK